VIMIKSLCEPCSIPICFNCIWV